LFSTVTAFQLRRPVLGALEHDPLYLCNFGSLGAGHRPPEPAPPSTSVVDTAIDLFAQLLPLQDLASASLTISQILEHVNSMKSDRNAGRKAAVSVNTATAFVLSLRHAASHHTRQSRESLGDSQVAAVMSSFLMVMNLQLARFMGLKFRLECSL
jgi:HEAT repeat-containing protein 5